MKARPIPLKAHEVRGILNGRKTQMRRAFDLPAGWEPEQEQSVTLGTITSPHPKKGRFGLLIRRESFLGTGLYEHDIIPCPYGKPGDVLWCRETHARVPGNESAAVHYLADGPVPSASERHDAGLLRAYPSIHMPRWASRITLEVTGIRVERLQDISEEDTRAEGITKLTSSLRSGLWTADGKSFTSRGPVKCFRDLWWEHRLTAKNVSSSWDANPWVWVMEFRPHLMNIDQFLKQREAA